jgi:hypothetical protein
LYENHSEKSLKGDLTNDTTVNKPLFSLVNTFKKENAKEVRKAALAAGEIYSTYVCHYQIFGVNVSVFGSPAISY